MNSILIRDENEAASDKAGRHFTVKVFRSLSEIEELRSVWESWNYHPNSDVEFYLLIAQCRPEIIRPHIIVLYRDEQPQAMLIGRVVEQRLNFKIGYRTAIKPKARVLNFVWAGTLGNLCRENSEVMVREVLSSLRHREADLAVFNNIPVDSPLYCFATSLPGLLSRDNFPDLREHWTMKLPDTVEEFYLGLSPKARRNRRQEANKLLRDHKNNVKIRCLLATDEVERIIQDVQEIAKKTYHKGLGVGFQDNVEMCRRLHLEAQQGRLRAYILYVEEKPCAFWLLTQYSGTMHGDFTGYDPAFSRYSPGTFLLLKIIEDSIKNGVKVVDFGSGAAWYKEFFCNCSRQEASPYIFAPALKGLTLNITRTPIVLVDYLAKRALTKVGGVQKLKRLWRSRAEKK